MRYGGSSGAHRRQRSRPRSRVSILCASRSDEVGLRGFVRNLYNGDVEIEAEGDRSMLEELIQAVKVGPRSAHVSDLKIEWKSPDHPYPGFDIR